MHRNLWVRGAVDEATGIQSIAIKETKARCQTMLQSRVFVRVRDRVDWEVDVETWPGGEHTLRFHVVAGGGGHELHTRHQLAELLRRNPLGVGFGVIVIDIHHHAIRRHERCS